MSEKLHRISIQIKCDDNFYDALFNNIEYFKNETLCLDLQRIASLKNPLKIISQNIELAIKRL